MKKLVVPSLAVVLAVAPACTRDAPTGAAPPGDPSAPAQAAARFSVAGGGALFSSPALDDIRVRLLPGFTDQDAADRFRGYLGDLDMALSTGDAEAARAALALARGVLDPSGDGSAITVTDRADAGVILLVLEQAETEIR